MLNQKITKIKQQALNDNVPIIMDSGLEFILEIIRNNTVKNILEIGTAVGYSTISFAAIGANVLSIERDNKLFSKAVEHVSDCNLNDKITLVNADALLYELDNKQMFDLIFIDAAKAQYQKFFEKYETYLAPNGVIVCDNLNFHNLRLEEVSRNTRQLIRKIQQFKTYLSNNQAYETTFYDVGDGMSVSKKHEKINNNL